MLWVIITMDPYIIFIATRNGVTMYFGAHSAIKFRDFLIALTLSLGCVFEKEKQIGVFNNWHVWCVLGVAFTLFFGVLS